MSNDGTRNMIIEHIKQLREKFPLLEPIENNSIIRGNLGFTVTLEDVPGVVEACPP
jgi:hypothetical protein